MVLDKKKYDFSFSALRNLIPSFDTSSISSPTFNKPKAIKFLALYAVIFNIIVGLNFYVYKLLFSYDYQQFLFSLFQFKTEFFNLFLLLPFSLLFSLVFIVVVAFSGAFEDSDGLYASIISFLSTIVLALLIFGSDITVVISSTFLALAMAYTITYIKKRIGLFRIRQLFWKGTYILFIVVSLAIALSFLASFFVDLDGNILVTKQAFINAPSIGTTSGLDALKIQLRQSYIIGFTEGVDYYTGGKMNDLDRQLSREEAKSRATEILESARGLEILSTYAEEFPYFDIILFVIPVFIAGAMFSLSFLFFTLILRPVCVILSLVLYEKIMRLYVNWNY